MATALITGGTSGIGAAFARRLAAEGFDLVLVARNEDRLDSMARELHAESGIEVETLRADLADRSDVARVAARIEDGARPIDMLINNAGAGVRTPLASSDVVAHEHAFTVMCWAVLVLGGAAARAMSGRGGTIINLSSLQTYLATGAYAANKAWVTAYSQSLAVELRGTGISATAVLPGWVRTEWHARAGVERSSLPDFLWIDPDVVARVALRDARRGKVISIPSVRYRVIGWIVRHLPHRAVLGMSARISSGRNESLVMKTENP
ncbi:MAG: SDR family NAD(P)-dependent oxidoreductase [Rhodoglobus sp.]